MGRRTLLLVAAVLVAALGTALIVVYVRGIDQRALAGQQQVSVVVAVKQIGKGTSVAAAVNAKALEVQQIPLKYAVDGYVSSLQTLAPLTVLTTLYAGQQVVSAEVGPSTALNAVDLPGGMVAVAISLGDAQRVAAFLNPQDNVAVYVSDGATKRTRVLIPTAEVIGVGSSTSTKTSTNEQLARALITLAVKPADAPKVIVAASSEQLYLVLLQDGVSIPVDSAATASGLFN